MVIPLRKIKKGGTWHYVPRKLVVLKKVKQFMAFPGHDERGLLDKGRYFEAVMQTSHRIEKSLKNYYFYTFCPDLVAVYYEFDCLSFLKIMDLCRASKLITKEEYKKIDLIRQARNELAHHPYAKNSYIDSKKCKNILEPCILIIEELHSKLIKLTKEAENKKEKKK